MVVYEATLVGEARLPERTPDAEGTLYEALEWRSAASLREAADAGSLCCRLFLETVADTTGQA